VKKPSKAVPTPPKRPAAKVVAKLPPTDLETENKRLTKELKKTQVELGTTKRSLRRSQEMCGGYVREFERLTKRVDEAQRDANDARQVSALISAARSRDESVSPPPDLFEAARIVMARLGLEKTAQADAIAAGLRGFVDLWGGREAAFRRRQGRS
jgi:hypothetical protein